MQAIDLEAENRANLWAIGVLDAGVLRGRVHAHAAHGECLAVSAHVEHCEVESVRAVKVHRLRVRSGRRVALADEVMKAGVVLETDRVNTCRDLRAGEAVGDRFDIRERMVGYRVRPRGAERTAHDREGVWRLHITRLNVSLA